MSEVHRVLPVTATFVRAYHLVWYNRIRLARAAAIPFVFLALSNGLYFLMFAGVAPDTDVPKYVSGLSNVKLAICALSEVIGAWTLMSFNVSWRRYLLLLSPDVEATYFRKPLWRYVVALFLTVVASITSLGLFDTIVEHLLSLFDPGLRLRKPPAYAGTVAADAVLVTLALCVVIGTILRHAPFYTRLMTDTPHFDFREIRAAMRGNVLRLLVILILTFCTLGVATQAILFFLARLQGHEANVVLAALQGLLTAFLFVAMTALLSAVAGLVYDFALPGDAKPADHA
jgi:hypothetical protein